MNGNKAAGKATEGSDEKGHGTKILMWVWQRDNMQGTRTQMHTKLAVDITRMWVEVLRY